MIFGLLFYKSLIGLHLVLIYFFRLSPYLLDVPKWFGDFYEAFFGALWLDCDQSLSVIWNIIQPHLKPFMNLDKIDGKKYLEDLNPIRKLKAHKDTDGNSLTVFPGGKPKPARTLEDISKVIVEDQFDPEEFLHHLDKFFIRMEIKNERGLKFR